MARVPDLRQVIHFTKLPDSATIDPCSTSRVFWHCVLTLSERFLSKWCLTVSAVYVLQGASTVSKTSIAICAVRHAADFSTVCPQNPDGDGTSAKFSLLVRF